jgi:hypothetical protein
MAESRSRDWAKSNFLSAEGDFTSPGIDDNATGERLQLADTLLSLGTTGALYTVAHAVDDQQLVISGGNGANSGGNVVFRGGTTAGASGDFLLRTGATDVIVYDHDVTTLDLAADVRTFSNSAGTEQARISSTGELLLGKTTSIGTNVPLQISNNDFNFIDVEITSTGASGGMFVTNSRVPTLDGELMLFRCRDEASKTLGDTALVMENGSDDKTYWRWNVNVDGTTSREVLRLDSTGTLIFNTSYGDGVKLDNLGSSDANTMDDYEEGSWTPTIQDSSNSDGEGQTYSLQNGRYQKVGNKVTCWFVITSTSNGTLTGSDTARIAGLPFTSRNALPLGGGTLTNAVHSGSKTAQGPITLLGTQNATIAPMYEHVASGVSAVTITELGTGTLYGRFDYEV